MLQIISLIVFAVVLIIFIAYTGRINNNYIRLNAVWVDVISAFKKENGKISIFQLLFFIGVPLGLSFICVVERTITETVLVILNLSAIGIAIILTGILLILGFFRKKENKSLIKETGSFIIADIALCFYEVFTCLWIILDKKNNNLFNSWIVYFLMFLVLLSLFIILKRVHVILTAD